MDTNELIKKVRKIEIATKTLSRDLFAGSYHTNFKGRGMAFSEVREYQIGDEVRTIDWNVSARYRDTYVKVFEEEREISVMLVADISGSGDFASSGLSKKEIITYISAIIAFSASQNQDKTGLLLFSDRVEELLLPKKGKSQILRIIRELVEHTPKSKGTDLAQALVGILSMLKKRSIVFVLSDFMTGNFERELEICARKHETIAVRVHDPAEDTLPDLGLINYIDAETGKLKVLNTTRKARAEFARRRAERAEYLEKFFMKNKIGYIDIATTEDYVKSLVKYFRQS